MRAVLSSSSLFKNLDPGFLSLLEAEMQHICLPGGRMLFRQGDSCDGVYIVLHGRLKASIQGKTVGEISKGESVGELALILGGTRSADVTAVRDTELAFLSKAHFEQLLSQHPVAMLAVTRLIIERYQRQLHTPKQSEPTATIAILSLGKETGFITKLKECFSHTKQVRHLTKPDVLLHASTMQDMSRYLNEMEIKEEVLLLEAMMEDKEWTSLCLRQADRILVVAHSNHSEALSSTREQLLELRKVAGLAKWELVLLHDKPHRHPVSMKPWLAVPFFERWHHVILERKADYERIVRWMTGKAVGLVLSGGGARGFAHMGVIRALEEARIPIDSIGGVSMGSVIAAEYAAGWNEAEMIRCNRDVMVEQNALGDFTLPLISLAVGKRATRAMQRYFGNLQIEDLWLPYFCLSCNLSRAEEYIHESGPVWEGLRASTSLPGIVSPMVKNGELYVDGGVINNLPSDVMRNRGVGKVIAIDVASSTALTTDHPDTDSVSPWELLIHRFLHNDHIAMPGIFSILLRAGTIGSITSEKQAVENADMYVNIPLEGFGMLDWKSMERIIESGYRYMKEVIDQGEMTRLL